MLLLPRGFRTDDEEREEEEFEAADEWVFFLMPRFGEEGAAPSIDAVEGVGAVVSKANVRTKRKCEVKHGLGADAVEYDGASDSGAGDCGENDDDGEEANEGRRKPATLEARTLNILNDEDDSPTCLA